MKVRIADKITVMENFEKYENSSSIEVSSAATRVLWLITAKGLNKGVRRFSLPKYSTVFLGGCRQQKEFSHSFKLAYFIHTIQAQSNASCRIFSTAGCMI